MKKTDNLITHSPGIVAPTGQVAGGGYGKNSLVSAECDRAAEWMAAAFGQAVQVRGNSHGRSGGAFHPEGGSSFASHYGLTLRLLPESETELRYQAFFNFPAGELESVTAALPEARTSIDPFLKVAGFGEAWSPEFETLEEAAVWLETWGRQHCPEMQKAEPLPYTRPGWYPENPGPLYRRARVRVLSIPELARYGHILLHDWPAPGEPLAWPYYTGQGFESRPWLSGEAFHAWLLGGPVEEIAAWARYVETAIDDMKE